MQTVYLSIYVNIILGLALVTTVFGPRVIQHIKNRKKIRERREVTTLRRLIKTELTTYFKDLKK